MTYAIAFTIGGLFFSSALGKLLKRNLDNYPNCDDEGEVENFLAGHLAVALATDKRRAQP